jgi:hypothetical protein
VPNLLPVQVYLLVPPQVPSGETLETGVGVAKALVVEVDPVLLVVAGFDVEGDVLDVVGITEELLLEDPHVPATAWHPVPQ